MDMDMGDMDMSGMDMSNGSVDVLWVPQIYWIFVGSVIAACSAVNLLNYVLFRQR